jgi:EPS-associated MarR family transcriptional regulator
MLTDEVRYKILSLLEASPTLSQRDVARKLGISLGKANYCLKALAEKGWIKATNFKNSQNKIAYMYLLTPRGIQGRARVAARFLQIKVREYDQLKTEIERIRAAVNQQDGK